MNDAEHQRFVDELWNLVQHGIVAGWDDRTLPDQSLSETPEDILNSEAPQVLCDYQLHGVNRVLKLTEDGFEGSLLACGMGLDENLMVIGLIPQVQAQFAC